MGKKIRIQDIEISVDSYKSAQEFYIKSILEANANPNAESLTDKFMEEYEKLLKINKIDILKNVEVLNLNKFLKLDFQVLKNFGLKET